MWQRGWTFFVSMSCQRHHDSSQESEEEPGLYEIPAEMLKHGKNVTAARLNDLFNKTWTVEDFQMTGERE